MTLPRDESIRVLETSTVYAGRIFDVVRERIQLPSGLEQQLTIIDHAGAVGVAALDAENKLLLVRQYRHACGEWLLEIPAGRIERGEDRLNAAMRELEEETGHRAASWEVLHEFFAAPGFCSEFLTIYLARGLVPVGAEAKAMDHDEELALERCAVVDLLATRPRDAKTLIAVLELQRRGLG